MRRDNGELRGADPPLHSPTCATTRPNPDVEFNSTHQLSTQEAVDVAIPPVLDEAIMELSSSDPQEVASIVRDLEAGTSSGWSSPVTPAPSSYHVQAHPYASKSRSPTRGGGGGGGGRSFSPDSASSASGRATSPGSSASFSIGTPGSSPPGSYTPFNQHLTEALRIESEARKKPGFSLGLPATGNLTALPFPSISSASSSASDSVGGPQPSGAALDATQTRLSFFSLADVINEERLAELTVGFYSPGPECRRLSLTSFIAKHREQTGNPRRCRVRCRVARRVPERLTRRSSADSSGTTSTMGWSEGRAHVWSTG